MESKIRRKAFQFFEDKDDAVKDVSDPLFGQTATGTNLDVRCVQEALDLWLEDIYDAMKDVSDPLFGQTAIGINLIDIWTEDFLPEIMDIPASKKINSTTHKLFEDKDDARKDAYDDVSGQRARGTHAYFQLMKEAEDLPSQWSWIKQIISAARKPYEDFHKELRGVCYLLYGQTATWTNICDRLKEVENRANARKAVYEDIFGKTAREINVYDRWKKVRLEFEGQSANGKADRWKDEARINGCAFTSIDPDCFRSVDGPHELGSEKLMEHTPLEKLDKRHFAKGEQKGGVAAEHQNDDSKQIALMEVHRENVYEILVEKRMQTKENVAKEQAPLSEEVDSEMEDEEVPDIESDDEDQQIDNSLKLPMAGDGKPIPYWLYKLRALRQAGDIYH